MSYTSSTRKKEVEHGQNVKIHFSITLDISGILMVYSFVSTCFVMQNANSAETESKNCHIDRNYHSNPYIQGTIVHPVTL